MARGPSAATTTARESAVASRRKIAAAFGVLAAGVDVRAPSLPLAGLGQHLALVLADQLADLVGMGDMAVSCLLWAWSGRSGP